MLKNKIIIISIVLAAVLGISYFAYSAYNKSQGEENQNNIASQCDVKEIIFYYLTTCEWCNKVKSEGTIEKIEALGIKVKKVNAAIGPIRDKFEGVPTFVINKKVYTGYKTFDEIKQLLYCPVGN